VSKAAVISDVRPIKYSGGTGILAKKGLAIVLEILILILLAIIVDYGQNTAYLLAIPD
jgi:hypothetical protein